GGIAVGSRELLLIQAERTANVGSWTWDPVSNEVYWSPEMFRLLGYHPDKHKPSTEAFFAALHPEDRERVQESVARNGPKGIVTPTESRVLLPDGTVREIITDGMPVYQDGKLVRFVGTMLDMTERRAAMRDLQRSELLLNEAQRVAHVGSWYWDQVRDVVEWSDEFYRIFGVSRAEAPRSRDFFALIVDEDRERTRMEARIAATTGANVNTEFRIRRKTDGAIRHCLCHAQTIHEPGGRPLAFVGTVFDVTERMELELQLRQAQKMEALGRLAGGVAHEFNNLLTVILGHAQLLNPETARDERRAIVQAAEGAGELTRHLLSFSRQAVRAPVLLNLDEVVATVGKLATRVVGRQIQVLTERDLRPGLVRADANQLQQVLLNLALNAKDAMPEGGTLRLRTSTQTLDAERAARIPGAHAGEYAVIEVSDTGVGMDARTRARIFEPFFTTKPAGKGTGLGLAIVYGAVRQSGGMIEVDSEPGHGTTFRIYLPADTGETTPSNEPPAPSLDETRGTGTVMVVEDDVEVGNLIARILGDAGYTVRLAHDMCQADDQWRAHGAETDLLITDVVMPERGGVQTARLFRAERPTLRVLFMSGYAPEESDETPPRDWLEKPFSPEALLARVRAALV
ncbi:MAG TPA: PAS domain-containing protein, partial [Polyangia bacterium]|nr:PAS domain-containing protein [Polyangia bacterium]